MTEARFSPPRYALEALVHDAAFYFMLLKRAIGHKHSGLIMFGMVPLTSLFVVESYDYLSKVDLGFRDMLGSEYAQIVRASRHRAKLFGSTPKLVARVLGTLQALAAEQRAYFNRDHTGLLGLLRRYIQPDLGLYTYDGHIFTTTHEPTYNFGEQPGTATSLSIDDVGRLVHRPPSSSLDHS